MPYRVAYLNVVIECLTADDAELLVLAIKNSMDHLETPSVAGVPHEDTIE